MTEIKPITDNAGAKAVARRIWDWYNKDNDSTIDKVELLPMMSDAYARVKMPNYNPNRTEIDSFYNVLTMGQNKGGKISYDDIERFTFSCLIENRQF
mmetsp:Transcript_50143/g.76257  ORF Transcript_50143/g.76257 Transcript_50143/m.76257 type:complete len:97 (-) Transcript_50143:25-315(-)